MKTTHWARLLTYVSGLVNEELLLRNEYLAAENRILRAHIQGRLHLSDPERATRRVKKLEPRNWEDKQAMRNSKWVRLLAYVTGSINQELLVQNEYLATENRILRTKLPARLRLSDPERVTLAAIGKRVGRKALREIACIAKPDTILAWYRKLISQKFDGSKQRQYPGRPRIDAKLEALIVRMGRENSGWGYDRIVGALANLGHAVSDQTVGNVLRRHGIAPAPQRGRTMSSKDFLAAHMSVLAGADFFTVEVLKWRGLVTYYVLFFIHLETRLSRAE